MPKWFPRRSWAVGRLRPIVVRNLAFEFGEKVVGIVNLSFEPAAHAICQKAEARSKVVAKRSHVVQLLFFE